MSPSQRQKRLLTFFQMALKMRQELGADALLMVLDGPVNWRPLKLAVGDLKLLLAADRPEHLKGAEEMGLETVILDLVNAPVFEKLTQALLQSVADDKLVPSAEVIAIYSGYEPDEIDSISYICLDEHLGRLTSRDLRKLETSVPLETLKLVVDLAVEIGREGREGKPVGTMFVVGDTRRVMTMSQPAGYDPVKGYGRKERDLHDPRVREAVKEVAQLDGAFVVTSDGIVERSCQLLDSPQANLTMSKGLGARHWAGAAVSKHTKAIAVVVSESNGTVRLFQDGEVILRIEPFRRAMKWKDFDYEPPSASE